MTSLWCYMCTNKCNLSPPLFNQCHLQLGTPSPAIRRQGLIAESLVSYRGAPCDLFQLQLNETLENGQCMFVPQRNSF